VSVFAAILLSATSLHITVWPNGSANAPKHTYTLSCGPTAGTLPHRAAACRSLNALRRPFAPTPKNVACTQIYGGRQEAMVTGRLRGKLVHARFSRKDGCEIGRWSRVRFLFPGALSAAYRR
jgi:hypothetical protein